jgi:hypothetical protein
MVGSTSQLVQAMAGFDGAGGAGDNLNVAALCSDASQQDIADDIPAQMMDEPAARSDRG